MIIEVVVDENGVLPNKAHSTDAGFDLFSPEDVVVRANSYAVINTGVCMFIPDGYVGMIKSKSGLNVKHNLVAEGVIDAGYTGHIVVKIYNHGDYDYRFNKGDKLTQIVILPIPDVDLKVVNSFNVSTDRGDNGFGSSGK